MKKHSASQCDDREERAELHVGPGARRASLLGSMLVLILILVAALFVLVLLVDPVHSARREQYVFLIPILALPVVLAYWLNRRGRYLSSAVLLVACAVIAPWASALVDPAILRGDIIPLTWVFFSVLLSSILLPPMFTMTLVALQTAALTIVYVMTNTPGSLVNWPSLLSFFIASSIMAVLASVITQRDTDQIDRQTEMLLASETLLRERSVRDHLTGVFNRRYMEETLAREIERTTREARPIGLIMLDIDHFKNFNDTLGHPAGDELLRALGALLLESVRGSDIPSRWGGEEFVLVLPDVSAAVTMERAEELRAAIAGLSVEYEGKRLGTITVSVGVAAFPAHGATGDEVLRAADDAMFEAKAQGRNRVVLAGATATA